MRKPLIILTFLILFTGCNTINEIDNPTKNHPTSNSSFNREEYFSFVKKLVEDSLNYKWIYLHPVLIKSDIPLDPNRNYDSEIQLLPPAPPSILNFKFDSLSFSEDLFDSTKIFRNKVIFQKGKEDSLFDYHGTGIIISLPYAFDNRMFIDYETINWGSCGTGKYQTTSYNPELK